MQVELEDVRTVLLQISKQAAIRVGETPNSSVADYFEQSLKEYLSVKSEIEGWDKSVKLKPGGGLYKLRGYTVRKVRMFQGFDPQDKFTPHKEYKPIWQIDCNEHLREPKLCRTLANAYEWIRRYGKFPKPSFTLEVVEEPETEVVELGTLKPLDTFNSTDQGISWSNPFMLLARGPQNQFDWKAVSLDSGKVWSFIENSKVIPVEVK